MHTSRSKIVLANIEHWDSPMEKPTYCYANRHETNDQNRCVQCIARIVGFFLLLNCKSFGGNKILSTSAKKQPYIVQFTQMTIIYLTLFSAANVVNVPCSFHLCSSLFTRTVFPLFVALLLILMRICVWQASARFILYSLFSTSV